MDEHPHNGISFSTKNKWAIKPQKRYEKSLSAYYWEKPVWKAYTLFISNSRTSGKCRNKKT